jgi:hypothetical protein
MDSKKQAMETAGKLLSEILKTQPNLLTAASGAYVSQPKDLANFCSQFIEQYADNLVKMNAM